MQQNLTENVITFIQGFLLVVIYRPAVNSSKETALLPLVSFLLN